MSNASKGHSREEYGRVNDKENCPASRPYCENACRDSWRIFRAMCGFQLCSTIQAPPRASIAVPVNPVAPCIVASPAPVTFAFLIELSKSCSTFESATCDHHAPDTPC